MYIIKNRKIKVNRILQNIKTVYTKSGLWWVEENINKGEGKGDKHTACSTMRIFSISNHIYKE